MQVGPMPVDFTNFQFHHFTTFFALFSHVFTIFANFLNVGKETTAFDPGRKIAVKVHVRLISGTRT